MTLDSQTRRKKICIVATVPFALNVLMRPLIEALSVEYDLTLVANGSHEDVASLLGGHVTFVSVKITRKISIVSDSIAIVSLWRLFRREEFDCVHSIMPKSGLLAMLAARVARVPVRLHTFTGQVWVTRRGPLQSLLKSLDKVLAASATQTLTDSRSQRTFLIEQKVTNASAIRVLADGSLRGVDLDRFAFDAEARHRLREEFRIPEKDVVFLYLGRLNKDKGIHDLLQAFALVTERSSDTHLLLIGPDEDNFAANARERSNRFSGRVHWAGYTDRPEDFMSAADVLCLPSYREGFPNVIIESAAVGLPAVASRIYGITDSIEDGITGFLHEPHSVRELATAMIRLSDDRSLRLQMGAAARDRAATNFSQKCVTQALIRFYRERLAGVQLVGPHQSAAAR